MLKEYRICLPMTVDEYRIGQLYMIARHSSEQSENEEGVEVIENRPHTDPVHGDGQFTEKRIHLSSKLPVWVRGYVPRFIYLTEKAWNYYPYTETEYTCSVIPRFSIKIRTRYENNNGCTENCLNASEEELKTRVVDHVDILTDPVDERHFKKDEDPATYISQKTGRGPLKEGWRDIAEIIMCSYKLVDVSFQVFGFQTKVEEWSQRAIRNVLLLGHRQAFTWMDDWHGMTLEEVREYEIGMQEETNARIRTAQEKQQENTEEKGIAENETTTTEDGQDSESPSSESSQKGSYLSSWFKWS